MAPKDPGAPQVAKIALNPKDTAVAKKNTDYTWWYGESQVVEDGLMDCRDGHRRYPQNRLVHDTLQGVQDRSPVIGNLFLAKAAMAMEWLVPVANVASLGNSL